MTDRSKDGMKEAYDKFVKDTKQEYSSSLNPFEIFQAAVKWATERQIKTDAEICDKTLYSDSNTSFTNGYMNATEDCAKFIRNQQRGEG